MAFSNKKWKNSQTGAKVTNCFLVELSGTVTVPESLLLMMVGLLLCVHYESAEGIFIEKSKNEIVIVNHSTFFNCSKSSNKSTEPAWYHHPLVGAREDVYDYGKIIDKYKDRFNIDKNTTSDAFNLLVLRPLSKDAGRYECVEEDGEEDKGPSAELTVLHSNLVCESDKDLNEIIGPTECSNPIAPDQLQLLCNATYSGNISPRMQWRRVGSELLSNKTKCDVHDNRVMCNAALEANLNIDGSVYICQIITAQQYNCSLKINKTIYAFANTTQTDYPIGKEVTCVANVSNQLPCTYKWFDDNMTEVSSNETFKPNDPGLYRCQAQCAIRDESCKFTAMVINVSTLPDSGSNLLHCLWLLLLIPVIGVTLAIWFKDIWLGWLRKEEEVVAIEINQLMDRAAVGPEAHRPHEDQPPEQLREQRPAKNAHERQPLIPTQSNATDNVDSGNAIQAAFNDARHIRKGLSGEIRGPGQHEVEGIQSDCSYEKIECHRPNDQQSVANERKKAVYDNGQMWRKLNHENLIQFYDIVLKSSATCIYIAMEYATKESLREELEKTTTVLLDEVVMDWATQIAKGLYHLHDRKIVHKNIKSTQIFIVESSAKKTLKIACFNLFNDDSNNDASSVTQSLAYSPPEGFANAKFSYDVWSFGIVIWEMLTKKEPYKDMASFQIMNDILKGAEKLKIPAECPEKLKEILEGCRKVRPSERPTFSDILLRLE